MPPFPSFSPQNFRRPISRNYSHINKLNNLGNDFKQKPYFPSSSFNNFTNNDRLNSSDNSLNEINKKSDSNDSYDSNYFDFLGIRLYFDDLLIIGLLIFLYNEEVKDTYLYIALILLLLS